MDKLVYLHELDSVHTSREEILRGQQALFEEIVLNGNQVVLTFNQLTDSQAFLAAVRDRDAYPHLLELFHLGAIRVSRFAPPNALRAALDNWQEELSACKEAHGRLFQEGVLRSYPPLEEGAPQRVLRTASHYVQNAVEKCLNDTQDSFLFSALPFRSGDKIILAALSYALRYSDPSVLDTCAASFAFPEDGEEGPEKAAERLDYVKRYVEMILRLSREPLAANPEKQKLCCTFSQMLDRIYGSFFPLPPPVKDKEFLALILRALALLDRLRKETFRSSSPNNRSNWHNALSKEPDEPWVRMAEAIVDLCYNYTMEESISGLAHHYWDQRSFQEDLLSRLRQAWEDDRTGVHRFHKGDQSALLDPPPEKLPHWDTAVRLLRSAPPKGSRTEEKRYEAIRPGERRNWYLRLGHSFYSQIKTAAIYFVLFLLTSLALEFLEEYLSQVGARFQLNDGFQLVFNIILFGLLGSLVSSAGKLPDILDNTKAFFATLRDAWRLLRAPRRIAYSRGTIPERKVAP